jgi:hypothetical protein
MNRTTDSAQGIAQTHLFGYFYQVESSKGKRMPRRAVCVVTLSAFLLSQWGSVGHCHGIGQPAGHDQRPHFHLGCGSHCHAHAGPVRQSANDDAHHEPSPSLRHLPPHHDDDAVYLPAPVDLGLHPSADSEAGSDDGAALALFVSPSATAAPFASGRWRSTHAPPGGRPDSGPLYLQTHALLI